MKVTEVTLTTAPTIVIGSDYIKASATITFTLSDKDDFDASVKEANTLLRKAYRHALLGELQNITQVQKKETRVRIVNWLKGLVNGKDTSSKDNS